MRPSGWLFLTQLSICCALAGSAVLYVHYMSPLDSGFCGPGGGCELARRSGIGYFGSRYVTLPLFALVAFGGLLGLSLRRRRPVAAPTRLAELWQDPSVTLFAASGVGALLGLGLIAYQAFGLGAYCWLCLVVDISAVACAVFAFLAARATRSGAGAAEPSLHPAGWLGIAALIVAGPIVWDAVKPAPPIPATISALYQPGKINVVEFADFECPYCRRLHGVLAPLLAEYGDQVFFVRAHRPLLQHQNALHAARIVVCATAQGKGDELANRLFEIELSVDAINGAADALGLDRQELDRCQESEETNAALERDRALLPDGQLRGLPTTFIGGKQFVGVPSEAALRDALERARDTTPFAPSGFLYASLLASLVGLVAFVGFRAAPRPESRHVAR
jgi:predicted DsbA family dithiol-disulfide isomerase